MLPGGIHFPAVAEPDPVGATLVFSTGPVAFSAATFAGTMTSNVFNNDATNPFGPNALTFTYSITNGGASPHDIERMSVASFGTFLTDASFQASAGVPPTIISRSDDGQVMGFNFISPAVDAGQTTSLLVVQTNATVFSPTTANLINGSVTTALSVAPLPEPAAATLSLALGFAAAARRRRMA
jgi:hypothetical protein